MHLGDRSPGTQGPYLRYQAVMARFHIQIVGFIEPVARRPALAPAANAQTVVKQLVAFICADVDADLPIFRQAKPHPVG